MPCEKEEEEYIKRIRELKQNGKAALGERIEIKEPLMSLDDAIEQLELANRALIEMLGESHSIRDHLEHMIGKGVSFEDRRFENLFLERNILAVYPEKTEPWKKREKLLDYGYHEKLAGFVSKSGRPEWDEDKIDAFVESIK